MNRITLKHLPDERSRQHAQNVSASLRDSGYSHDVIMAGLFHDIIEDTSTTRAELNAVHGPKIANIVSVVTRKDSETYAEYIRRIAASNDSARAVKIADLNDNLSDHPPGARRDKYELALMILTEASE